MTDLNQFRSTCIRLREAANKLNQARDRLRVTAARIAGTDLEGWDLRDCSKYLDLFLALSNPNIGSSNLSSPNIGWSRSEGELITTTVRLVRF